MSFMTMEGETTVNLRPGALRITLAAIVFWGIAVLGVHLSQSAIGDPTAQFGIRLTVIALCGALLGWLGAAITTDHALLVGMAWAGLAIGTEIFLTSHGMHGWYELLGNPSTTPDWMRAVTVVVWLLAPKLAARGGS